MAFEVENLEATLGELRARGVTFARFEMPGFYASGDTIAAPDNYPSKGAGEIGRFFYGSEGNLIGSPSRSTSAEHGANGARLGAPSRIPSATSTVSPLRSSASPLAA